MAGFLICLVNFLFCSRLLVNGQCTAVSTDKGSESDEELMRTLEEHDLNLRSLGEKLFYTVGNFEVNVNRSMVRGLEEHDENLRAALQNLSSAFENGDKKLLQELEKHTQNMRGIYHDTSIRVEETKQFLMGLSVNLSSQVEKIDESIQAANETLKRKLEEPNQRLISLYQNLSSNIDEKFDLMQNAISKKVEKHEKNLELIDQNLSSKFKSTNESIMRVLENDENIQQMYERLSSRLQAMNESMVRFSRDNDLKLQATHENFTATIEKVYDKLNAILDLANETILYVKPKDYCSENLSICDCSTIRLNGFTTSAVYRIFVDDQQRRYYANAFCDMTTTNGDWTVFQRRRDGSEDFYRGWNDYANGFGNSNGEFWLGNEFLHLLTSKRRYRLRIDMEDFSDNKRYAEYSTFAINNSTNKYRLTVSGYSGTAGGDSLASYHNGVQFSTKDNGPYPSCARSLVGAWWYQNCAGYSSLNGRYVSGSQSPGLYHGVFWYYWRQSWTYSLKASEMKITPAF